MTWDMQFLKVIQSDPRIPAQLKMGWKMYTKLYLFYNGDRTERSPIQSVIIRVFAEETVEWTQIVHVSNCTKWPGGEVVVVGESLTTW